jgi:nitroimidazol reductase NimA-like FMN-containing flavoprotein (pyridoxamine 5'-phosphate oxidase superfamily)
MSSESLEPTPRTRLKRLPRRGSFDRETIDGILDEGLICHVGFQVDGRPFVIPTAYARMGDRLVFHGSVGSRMLRHLDQGFEASVCVTLLDGLVLARSAFHHSMNYRSVVLFGRATAIRDRERKLEALDALVEHLVPGRTAHARGANERELKATEVMEMPIDEGSAKVRTGPPQDDDDDLALPVWAGLIPLRTTPGSPVAAPDLADGIEPPDYATSYRRP